MSTQTIASPARRTRTVKSARAALTARYGKDIHEVIREAAEGRNLHGPFATADEAMAFLDSCVKKSK